MYLDEMVPGKILDVGCGDGKFLNQMRTFGWTVDGIDFDNKAIARAERAYGLKLRQGDLKSAEFPENNFDAITISHVIEHVPNPVDLLAEVRRIVRPDGRVVLTTPNANGFGHEAFRNFWFGIDPPRHLQIFTPQSLRSTAERAGLKIQHAGTSAANADIFFGGSESIQNWVATDGESDSSRINVLRAFRAIMFQYRESIRLRSEPLVGEEIVLVASKES